MDEALRIFVLGIEWFALWLERSPLHVAWPVLFVILFQFFLSIVHAFGWYARGMLLRVACDYPITTSKGSDPARTRRWGSGTAAISIATDGSGSPMATSSTQICRGGRPSDVAAGGRSASTAMAKGQSAPNPAGSACSITAVMPAGRRK